jgi:hypothetical protein
MKFEDSLLCPLDHISVIFPKFPETISGFFLILMGLMFFTFIYIFNEMVSFTFPSNLVHENFIEKKIKYISFK